MMRRLIQWIQMSGNELNLFKSDTVILRRTKIKKYVINFY